MTSGLKLHTPEGFSDTLPRECALKRSVESGVMEVFRSFGYQEAETPTVEYADVFSDGTGLLSGDERYQFFDRSGRILTLRSDITTPIARMAATKFGEDDFPLKLCYLGKGYRFEEVYRGVVQREFTQAGVELLGAEGVAADAEVAAATIEALLACGLKEFQVDLGQVAFFRGLLSGAVEESTAETLRALIDRKDSVALENMAEGLPLDGYVKQVLTQMPRYFGEADMLDAIDTERLPEAAQLALHNLRRIYDILCDYGYERYISIDLSMVPALNYYTGMILKGFARGVGFSICGGGRYDNLMSRFGKRIPATGVAVGVDRLIAALLAQGETAPSLRLDAVVCAQAGSGKAAYAAARALRQQGMVVEQYMGSSDAEQGKAYAQKRGAGGMFYLRDDGQIQVFDFVHQTETIRDLAELMGE